MENQESPKSTVKELAQAFNGTGLLSTSPGSHSHLRKKTSSPLLPSPTQERLRTSPRKDPGRVTLYNPFGDDHSLDYSSEPEDYPKMSTSPLPPMLSTNPFVQQGASPISKNPFLTDSDSSPVDESPYEPPRKLLNQEEKEPVPQPIKTLKHHASVDNLQRPQLPPRPSAGTSSDRNISEAPPLPSRPILSSKASLHQSESSLTLGSRTLTHQLSVERFNALKIKETVLNPDTTKISRKPPFQLGSSTKLIQHRGPLKCLGISKNVVVTGSQNIRVFLVSTGENIRTVTLNENKPLSLAFVPTWNPLDEEVFVWVGLEKGELLEINTRDGRITDRRSLHSAGIIHILRFRETSLVTLDEQGALKIWTEIDSRGIVALSSRPRGLRVNAKHNIASLHGDHLWLGSGRNIEVYHLAPDALTVLLKKLEWGQQIGNLSRIAQITVRDTVLMYTGHDDGKIVEWDPTIYERKRIFQCGIYRITALFGVSPHYLWAGFSTGKIAIYDLGGENASLIKEFQAHANTSVVDLVLDEKSLFHSRQHALLSLSDHGEMGLWDGFLIDDWIDNYVRQRETEYCSYQNVKIQVCSWNIDSRKPSDLDTGEAEDILFIEKWIDSIEDVDVIVIGFQELVDLESTSVNAKSLFNIKGTKQDTSVDRMALWQDHIQRAMKRAFQGIPYTLLECQQMVGLFQCIFLKESISGRVSHCQVSTTKTGLGGYHGNKGGIATRFIIDDSSFCFVNCHLAAHQSHVSARNTDIANILKDTGFRVDCPEYLFVGGGDGSAYLDHENCFFSGDLNYRIDLPRSRVLELVQSKDWRGLQVFDQLLVQMDQNAAFGLKYFTEGPLEFAPTFKYDRNSHYYDSSEKQRVPAWCDRILWKGENTRLIAYERLENRMSDHRPIRGSFSVRTKSVQKLNYASVYDQASQAAELFLQNRVQEYCVQWTAHACRSRFEEAYERLNACQWDISHVFRNI